jgi:hypothetical protein
MKFAHLADCHLGSWREPKLRELNSKAFGIAVNMCIKQKVDFVLISGDLFNTSIPAIDVLKETIIRLKKLKSALIPVYIIAGSHDFSPSGKTMLDVLEHAELLKNVAKAEENNGKLQLRITTDPKTGAKITGMIGKKGMLEKSYYEMLDKSHLEKQGGFKIFMLHTAIEELKANEFEKMDSAPISLLPKGFDYYAAGHVHARMEKSLPGYRNIVYPGALFPNNFSELEKGTGGFYVYEDGKLEFQQIPVIKVHRIEIDCDDKTPQEIADTIIQKSGSDFSGAIVMLRLSGMLASGRPSEIDFRQIFSAIYENNAYFIMKNTAKLETKEYEEVKVRESSIQEIESGLIKENIGQSEIDKNEEKLIMDLMQVLDIEKEEGELNRDFDERLKKEMNRIFEI